MFQHYVLRRLGCTAIRSAYKRFLIKITGKPEIANRKGAAILIFSDKKTVRIRRFYEKMVGPIIHYILVI
jgi:hypothetical protein